jgi:putative ABC transport system permease protein
MQFYTFILKNVLRRPVRSVLTMTGMAVAVGAFVALVGISNGFLRSFLEIYERRGVDLVISKTQTLERLTSVVDERLGDRIAELPEVAAVSGGIVDVTQVGGEKGGVFGVIQGLRPDSFMFNELTFVAGRNLTAGDTGKRAVIIGEVLADSLKKHVGDAVDIYDEPFQLVGIYKSFASLEQGMAITLLPDLQKVLGRRPNEVTGFTVKLKREYTGRQEAVTRAAKEIEALDPTGKIRAVPYKDYVSSTTQIQAANAMALMTSSVAIIIGVIGILNTMVMSVFERTHEIGILRAIGWRPSRIMRMILLESMLLSLAGGVVGTLGAVVLTGLLSKLPQISGFLEGHISAPIVLMGFVVAILSGLVGAAYPAYRGSRLLPTEALRHE